MYADKYVWEVFLAHCRGKQKSIQCAFCMSDDNCMSACTSTYTCLEVNFLSS